MRNEKIKRMEFVFVSLSFIGWFLYLATGWSMLRLLIGSGIGYLYGHYLATTFLNAQMW